MQAQPSNTTARTAGSPRKLLPTRQESLRQGAHKRERGGPTRQGEDNEQSALYRGSIKDETMTLIVELAENNESVGTFTLTQGKSGRIRKCLLLVSTRSGSDGIKHSSCALDPGQHRSKQDKFQSKGTDSVGVGQFASRFNQHTESVPILRCQ